MSSATIQSSRSSVRLAMPTRRRSRFGIAWLLVFLGLAGLSAAGVFNGFSPNRATNVVATPVTAPDVDGPYKIVPIGERKPGQRSFGINPDRTQVDETIPDVDPPTWRELRLRMVKASGKLLWIDMLRSLEWLEEREARVGGTVWLELPEFGAVGEAEVLYLGPCPEIKPGRGSVITATFKHESDGNLFDLRLAGQAEATIVTGNHPYWSLDRAEYVEVANLREGERVNTAFGETTVASVTRVPEDEFVYNMEIHREHVYRVGSLGTLVHNAYPYVLDGSPTYVVYRLMDHNHDIVYYGVSNGIEGALLRLARHANEKSGQFAYQQIIAQGLTGREALTIEAKLIEALRVF